MNKILFCLISIILSTAAYGAILTPDEALKRALTPREMRHRIAASQKSDYKLVYSQDDAVYVFSKSDKGYIAVSGDDMAPAILGYSDNGTLDAGNIPPALSWWLGEYAAQIETMRSNFVKTADTRSVRPARSPISSLISTKWGQSTPFNNACPVYNGEQCLTGCVATTMAQLMNYYKYPSVGRGSISYTTGTLKIPVTYNFGAKPFDWENMEDEYTSSSSDVAKSAVAELMVSVGASVEMNFTPNVSGAPTTNIPSALIDYFNYDIGMQYHDRNFFTLSAWEELIYAELSEHRPVPYVGQSNEGGHMFICDGYSSDGYFHINWGWSGSYDGYFLLTALDPHVMSSIGSSSGYNFLQGIFTGIRTPVDGSTIYVNFVNEGELMTPANTTTNTWFDVYGIFKNLSIRPISGELFLRLFAKDGSYIDTKSAYKIENFKFYYSSGGFKAMVPSSLADGTYTAVPYFAPDGGKAFEVKTRLGTVSKLKMVKSGTRLAFTQILPDQSLHVANMALLSKIFLDKEFKLSVTLTNDGREEFIGGIAPVIVDANNNIVASGKSAFIDLEAGETTYIEYVGTFSMWAKNVTPSIGNYKLYIADTYDWWNHREMPDWDDIISEDYIDITIEEEPQEPVRPDEPENTEISVTGFVAKDAENVDPGDVELSGTVKCISGALSNHLTIFICGNDGRILVRKDTDYMFANEGESVAFTLKTSIPNVEEGTQCYVFGTYKDVPITETIFITIGKRGSGIESVQDSDAPTVFPTLTDGMIRVKGEGIEAVRIYDITGTVIFSTRYNPETIDLGIWNSGIYFVETIIGGKGTITKVIRR